MLAVVAGFLTASVGGFLSSSAWPRRAPVLARRLAAPAEQPAEPADPAPMTVRLSSEQLVKSLGDADSLELLLARDRNRRTGQHSQALGEVQGAAVAEPEADASESATGLTSSVGVAPKPPPVQPSGNEGGGLLSSRWVVPAAVAVGGWWAVSTAIDLFDSDPPGGNETEYENPLDLQEGDGPIFSFGKRVRRPETIRLLYQIECLDCKAMSFPARGREELFDWDVDLKCVICKSKNIVNRNDPDDPRNVRPDGTNIAKERRKQMRKYMTTDRKTAQRALSEHFALDAKKRKEYGREAVLGDEELDLLGINKDDFSVHKAPGSDGGQGDDASLDGGSDAAGAGGGDGKDGPNESDAVRAKDEAGEDEEKENETEEKGDDSEEGEKQDTTPSKDKAAPKKADDPPPEKPGRKLDVDELLS